MDKKFVSLMILFFLSLGLFGTYVIFNQTIKSYTRAAAESVPSSQTSLIFAWPLTAKTGDKVDVNVFVRSSNNSPLQNQVVKLSTNLGNISDPDNLKTDKSGKANFTLSSDTPGVAELTTLVNDNIQLSQKVSVKFE
jgi:hypothetical protein